jgi:hypothetical protein
VRTYWTEQEAEELRDILDNWIEGHAGGEDGIWGDQELQNDPDALVDMLDSYTDQLKRAVVMRTKLTAALKEADAHGRN